MSGAPPRFDAVAFAGGGARCYWQGGFWEALNRRVPQAPREIVAVSAGAFQACFSLLGRGEAVRARVLAGCRDTPGAMHWPGLLRGRSPFLVGPLYEALLAETFGPQEIAALRQAPPVFIQITRPPAGLPAAVAALPAIAAYQLEKAVTGAAHSRAGLRLGFRTEWVSTHELAGPEHLVAALMATASVPPFMPVGRVGGRPALDGGLTDNPPLARLAAIEAAGGMSLVLTTRHGRRPPGTARRMVVGPSGPIAVSKFTVTDGAGIAAAHALGRRDGEAFVRGFG